MSGKGFILVLTGPHGSGKSISVKCCANKCGLQVQVWTAKDVEDEEKNVSYCEQFFQYLKGVCSMKKALNIPGCDKKPLPSVLLLDAIPLIYTEAQRAEWKSCLVNLSKNLNKILCFVISGGSLKATEKLFEGIPYTLIEYY